MCRQPLSRERVIGACIRSRRTATISLGGYYVEWHHSRCSHCLRCCDIVCTCCVATMPTALPYENNDAYEIYNVLLPNGQTARGKRALVIQEAGDYTQNACRGELGPRSW